MKSNPYQKYLGKEDVLQNQVMRYIGLKYPKALFTHVANEGKRTRFEQYKSLLNQRYQRLKLW